MTTVIADWTRGGAGIAYQTCAFCNTVWYFQRGFCPACGDGNPVTRQASGKGTVHAHTSVARAPTEELRAHAPYLIVLVDADEVPPDGARRPDARNGDRVGRGSSIWPARRFRILSRAMAAIKA